MGHGAWQNPSTELEVGEGLFRAKDPARVPDAGGARFTGKLPQLELRDKV